MTSLAEQPLPYNPVFIRKSSTVVAWSPKAGCSHVVLWAFIHEGCFKASVSDSALPHKFRIQVYQKQPFYKRVLRRMRRQGGAGHTLIKFTRDPKRRLVSIFRHACRYPFLRKDVQEILGFDPEAEGLSLADLDAVLSALELTPPTTANPHVRAQYSPLWDTDFDRVITLNLDEVPLNPGLNAIERSLGLPVTDFESLPEFQRLRETHYSKEGGEGTFGCIETHRFKRHEAGAFPKQQILASPLTERMARRHYAIDWERVGCSDSAGELFRPAAQAAAK
jgi:hypothetical protein